MNENMAFLNLDGEYENQLNLARKLIIKIKDKADRSIALKYVNLLTSLKSDDVTVKRNRNAFFKYFLQVLENQLHIEAKHTIQCTCPIEHEVCCNQCFYNMDRVSFKYKFLSIEKGFLKEDLSDPLKYLQKEGFTSGEKLTTHWSKDKRSYVSAKIIPGRGALLYMAVSSDPDSEWDIRGPQKKN